MPELRGRTIGRRVVILPDEAPDMTEGGLHVPGVAKDEPATGTVLAVGEPIEASDYGEWPKKGDSVTYRKYAGVLTTIQGHEVLFLRVDDILWIHAED